MNFYDKSKFSMWEADKRRYLAENPYTNWYNKLKNE